MAINTKSASKSNHEATLKLVTCPTGHFQLTAMPYDPSLPPPEVNVLLLGDEEVGKSTFLSRLSLGIRPHNDDLPPYSLPTLRDSEQPFTFNVSLYNRAYSLAFSDTSSPTSYTLLRPDFIVLCYDISRRSTLESLRTRWLPIVNGHFNYDEALPVMVLGLKRDLRREWTEEEKKDGGRGECTMPQEGLGLATELLCDRYGECSAVTGELCREVLEDVARTCAKTTTENGAKSQGASCGVM
ncbi:P-loop containing nucleoside triphosphate hydrolase protein [Bimuria novae-zelandiae CBS 107.79]|uniref:P-loop containing nucleoside triphosphate hydrolase protein n=1 Tax=Bimuria novae-zelandiae CBS 107.79 TaxID=1447943 RepID=A0A6A5URW2_9PLEO|nr:P-loop containing nucleoside triphosphate hydrolase protein [Bimuria novae-zelandiae CBS 107.79]